MMQQIFPAVLVIVAVGIFFGYTSPTFTGPIADAQAKIKGYDSALQAAEQFKKREEELEVERAALPAEGLERLQAFLPDNVNNIQLILDLDALAARSGIRLSNFQIGDQTSEGEAVKEDGGAYTLKSDEPLGMIDLSVTATGTYTSFISFLKATEKSLRLLDVVSITVSSDTVTGVYTYDVTFRIYWLQ